MIFDSTFGWHFSFNLEKTVDRMVDEEAFDWQAFTANPVRMFTICERVFDLVDILFGCDRR